MSMPEILDYKTVTFTKNLIFNNFPRISTTAITTADNSQANVATALTALTTRINSALNVSVINTFFGTNLTDGNYPDNYIEPTALAGDDPVTKATVDTYLANLLNTEADGKNVQSRVQSYLTGLNINYNFTFASVTTVDNTAGEINNAIATVLSNFNTLISAIPGFTLNTSSYFSHAFYEVNFIPDEIVLKYCSVKSNGPAIYNQLCKIDCSFLGNKTLLSIPINYTFHENFNIPFKKTTFTIGEHQFYIKNIFDRDISYELNNLQITMCFLFIKYKN